jgi:hypothetical protein
VKTRTKFVICAVVNIIWFTLVVLGLTWFDKVVPDSLITAWFLAWTTELALLAGIKITGKSEEYIEEESEEMIEC